MAFAAPGGCGLTGRAGALLAEHHGGHRRALHGYHCGRRKRPRRERCGHGHRSASHRSSLGGPRLTAQRLGSPHRFRRTRSGGLRRASGFREAQALPQRVAQTFADAKTDAVAFLLAERHLLLEQRRQLGRHLLVARANQVEVRLSAASMNRSSPCMKCSRFSVDNAGTPVTAVTLAAALSSDCSELPEKCPLNVSRSNSPEFCPSIRPGSPRAPMNNSVSIPSERRNRNTEYPAAPNAV
ncbi:conserved hypothetical protein [Ricinus communis]|uniref:Uncharacterized protein n=1 Tax=Ricinus communis TaxID=3988 RepID=B9TED4_RICCO|nr:conserved hypothetical protein [Ricinus communis]